MSILLGDCKNEIDGYIVSCENKKSILNNIEDALKKCGINSSNIVTTKDEILWIRDIFFTVDDKCFICNLTKNDTMNRDRQFEKKSLPELLEDKFEIIHIPSNIKLEGGDIIQSRNDVFVGMGKRTSSNVLKFLDKNLPKKNIIPIPHSSLHLDCIFAVLNHNKIIYHSDYIDKFSVNKYEVLDIKSYVSPNNPIPCNMLICDDNIICSDLIKSEKLYDLLKILNYRVLTINIDSLWKEGGGIRCLTQWYTKLRKQYIY